MVTAARIAVALVLAAGSGPAAVAGEAGGALVYEVDADAARALGWVEADATDEEAARAAVERLADGLDVALSLALPEGQGARVIVEVPADSDAERRRRLDRAVLRIGSRLTVGLVARAGDLEGAGTTLGAEHERLAAWVEEHPGAPLSLFDRVPRGEGGPDPAIRWRARRDGDGGADPVSRALPLIVPDPEDGFGTCDVAGVHLTQGPMGHPAVQVSLVPERVPHFAGLTAANVGRRLAVVVDGVVHTAPSIAEKLPGVLTIGSRYRSAEAEALVALLERGRRGDVLRRAAD